MTFDQSTIEKIKILDSLILNLSNEDLKDIVKQYQVFNKLSGIDTNTPGPLMGLINDATYMVVQQNSMKEELCKDIRMIIKLLDSHFSVGHDAQALHNLKMKYQAW
jgi:hypothetical protein